MYQDTEAQLCEGCRWLFFFLRLPSSVAEEWNKGTTLQVDVQDETEWCTALMKGVASVSLFIFVSQGEGLRF